MNATAEIILRRAIAAHEQIARWKLTPKQRAENDRRLADAKATLERILVAKN